MSAGPRLKPSKPKKEKSRQLPTAVENGFFDSATFPRKNVPCYVPEGATDKERAKQAAALITSPELAAYRVIAGAESPKIQEILDVPAVMGKLKDQAKAVNDGDMSAVEAMLIGQAAALQTIFVRLTERGLTCEMVPAFESNMRIALKAQAQCRATLEALAEVKYPKAATFVRQQNVAYQQQVNNSGAASDSQTSTHAHARTEKPVNQSNELLSEGMHATLDAGGTGTAGGHDSRLEAVETVNGAKNARR